MSRPLAIPVVILLWILAYASQPASTAGTVPLPAAANIAVSDSLAPTAVMLAKSARSSEPLPAADGLLHLLVRQRPIEGASSILVTVKNIRVQKADAPEGLDWVTVMKEEKTFELAAAEQGEEVLVGKTLAEGLYSRVQLDFVSVKVTLKGKQKPAKVTSKRLREIRPFDIEMAGVCILTLDFDAAKSLVIAEPGEIQFNPVVRFLVRRGSPG